ncbi:unnamed protein product, partial [Polarella glacialis]
KLLSMGLSPNPTGVGKLMEAAAKAGSLERAEHWFQFLNDDLLRETQQVGDVKFNILINAAAKGGRKADAFRWFDRMVAAGLMPDHFSYLSLIEACSEVGDSAKAEELLAQMLRSRVQPELSSYNSVLDACGKEGRAERAEEMLYGMKAFQLAPDTVQNDVQIMRRFAQTDGHNRAQS